jgi:hypothetical protein
LEDTSMMRRAPFLIAALLVLTAGPAAAQNLKVEFHDGRVTVDAQSVPVRVILTEWGKAGGTKIVGAERVSGAPLTVKLVNVTEAQALETILRSVAGYMAAPRSAGVTGPSMYDRILVMATTSAPPPAAANARPAQQPNNAFNGTQRFVPPRRQEQPEQQEPDEAPEPDENPPSPPVFTFPQPGVNQPGQFQNAPPNAGQAGAITVNPPNGATGNVTISPASPSGPVGVSQPGMMVNPPAPNPPTAPGMIRPPRGGGNQ